MFINIKTKQKNMKIVYNYKSIEEKSNECYIGQVEAFMPLQSTLKYSAILYKILCLNSASL